MISLIVFLIVGIAAGTLLVLRRRQPTPALKATAVVLTLIVVAGASALALQWSGYLTPDGMSESDRRILAIGHGLTVGRRIGAAGHGGGKIFIVCAADETESETIAGLRIGLAMELDNEIELLPVALKRTVRLDEDADMALRNLLRAGDFDSALAGAMQAEALVFAVDLPPDAARLKLWKKRERPGIYLVDAADAAIYRSALIQGLIQGLTAVDARADLKEVRLSGDPEIAFACRCVYWDAETVQ